MLKIILKNLWMRRRQNAWLFAELVIVSILTWVIIDPAIVSFYALKRPAGYDADRIVNISVESYKPGTKKYDSQSDTPEQLEADYNSLLSKAASLPDVELSGMILQPLNAAGVSLYTARTGTAAIDTVVKSEMPLFLPAGSKFFSIYGIRAAEGSPSTDDIEAEGIGENECVITETVDRTFWPDRRGVRDKKFLSYINQDGDSVFCHVKAIVSDFRASSYLRSSAVIFLRHDLMGMTPKSFTIVLRLNDGVNAAAYAADNLRTIYSALRAGNFYVSSVTDQQSDIDDIQITTGLRADRLFSISLAAFFLLCLILGVSGCVWLQTGKRLSEMGVLRSFGARRSGIIAMLVGESVALATVAFLLGDFIYYQYAVKEGLATGHELNDRYIIAGNWIDSFGEHFALVSAVIYVIIIICVIIGTYFPARHVSRIEPVDALRDE